MPYLLPLRIRVLSYLGKSEHRLNVMRCNLDGIELDQMISQLEHVKYNALSYV